MLIAPPTATTADRSATPAAALHQPPSDSARREPDAFRLHNLRPVGGLPTASGDRVRGDRIWRSAAPFATRAASSRAIAELGVTTVIDLRDRGERERTPDAWRHPDLSVRAIPVFNDGLHTLSFDALEELYTLMIGDHGAHLASAFRAVTEHAADGVLIHCTAGKDRTGVLSALLLDVLGVERAAILEDFALSQARLGDDYLRDLFGDANAATLPGIAAHRATASPATLLAGAFARIDRDYGGSEAFLYAHGAEPADVTALRSALIA